MPLDYDRLMRWEHAPVRQEYTARDTILYALGIGASVDPFDPADLKYLYEGSGFVALPMMAVVLGQGPFWLADPSLGLQWQKILHGEQMLEIHQTLPTAGSLVAQDRVEEIYDKGADKGAVVYMTRELREEATGRLVATTCSTAFLRGDGGFGGTASGAPKPYALPSDRAPDLTVALPTRRDQAMIYRLSGDTNPLHIDPEVAAAAHFAKPILHGLCGYGVAGRAIVKGVCDNDPTNLKALDVRFASPMYPGDTIAVDIWMVGDGEIGFRARAVERDIVVLNNGRAIVSASRRESEL